MLTEGEVGEHRNVIASVIPQNAFHNAHWHALNVLSQQARQAITLQKERDAWKRLAKANADIYHNFSKPFDVLKPFALEAAAAEKFLTDMGQEV